jgi:hypothetical protein
VVRQSRAPAAAAWCVLRVGPGPPPAAPQECRPVACLTPGSGGSRRLRHPPHSVTHDMTQRHITRGKADTVTVTWIRGDLNTRLRQYGSWGTWVVIRNYRMHQAATRITTKQCVILLALRHSRLARGPTRFTIEDHLCVCVCARWSRACMPAFRPH